jgi:CelD/BcsL family acetyltransferase involved in cellulose biosynthesis
MTWTLTPAREFAAHAARWRQLNDESAAAPLLEPDFIQPLLAEFGTGDEWLASCERNGRTVAMAIVVRRKRGAWETFQPSQQPVGMWLSRPELPVPALLDELLRALPGMPLVLGLTQCDPFLTPRPADGARLASAHYIDTARVTVRGSFDDYWAARGKNLRSNLKKQRAKLLKEGIATRLDVRRDPADMAEAVADYGRLESAGWKAQGGTAIHPDNAQGRFYTAMLENFARRNAASVQRYWFGERLAAVNLCIEGGGANIVLKTTYDESLSSQYSPALLMREETTRLLFDEARYQREEFYGKVMEWHTRWTDEVRSMYHINHYRWAALLRLHTLRRRAPADAPAHTGLIRTSEPSTE